MVAVAVHISHGIWSLFQTFGLNHPRYMPLVMKLGLVVTFVFGIGFGILPIFIMIAA
jgi:succinate dehydrogenase / fumarate reductase cytochrome b subunit